MLANMTIMMTVGDIAGWVFCGFSAGVLLAVLVAWAYIMGRSHR